MALTRKFLAALGIEEEKAAEIINAHQDTLASIKQERDELKEKAETATTLQKDLEEVKKKLAAAEEADETETWKKKYETATENEKNIKKQFDEYKADVEGKELTAKKRKLYKDLLTETGVTEGWHDTILNHTTFSFDLDDDGAIKDKQAVVDAIKKDWSKCIGQQGVQGAKVPPGGNGSDPSIEKPMSYAARRAAQYNAEHYGAKEV